MQNDPLWRPNLIVFLSNACIMIIELVAGRMVAPYVGVSLYTWTSVIGVILAGISAGNFAGGKLADRRASRRLLGGLFLLAGLASLSVLASIKFFGELGTPASWPLILRVLAFITVVFFLPGAVLGTISPVVVKLTLRDLDRTGNVVGKIYASSALGSIVGTFATGFFLISWFGTRTILLVVGIVLVVLGILLGRWRRRGALAAVALVVLLAITLTPPAQALLEGPCMRESNYFCIKLRDRELDDGSSVRVLVLDRLVHSYTSLDDPTRLVYSYEKLYAEATEYLMARGRERRALFIGGGGYTFPKYIEAVYPQTEIVVAEIDPMVTQTAYDYLGLSADTAIHSVNEDARQYLINLTADETFDLILGDAFNDYSVPYHLTTHEFNRLVRGHLSDDGLYMVNLIDGRQRRFLASYVYTLQQTFPHVYVIPVGGTWREVVRTTFVILASPQALDLKLLRLMRAGDNRSQVDAWLLSEEEVATLLAESDPILLRDDYAPVDNLLATVFEESAAER